MAWWEPAYRKLRAVERGGSLTLERRIRWAAGSLRPARAPPHLDLSSALPQSQDAAHAAVHHNGPMNASLPRLSLSHDLIAAAFPDAAADDEAAQPELPPDAIEAMMNEALGRLGPRDDIWLFAYGSLMWAPEPELDGAETRLATLRGWHRRFCLWQWRYRGSRERPALVLALDRGGACRGLLFRVSGPDHRERLAGVFRRELRGDGYRPRWVGLEVDGEPLSALTFVVNRGSRRYAGRLADEVAAAHIASACGPKGPSAVYLLETAARCAALGIEDAMLDRLQTLVASEIARRLAETGASTLERMPQGLGPPASTCSA